MSPKEITLISQKEVQDYILAHQSEDPQKLLLQHKTFLGLPFRYIADQLIARNKMTTKAPFLSAQTGIVYPPSLNLEQSSSEATARLKVEIIQKAMDKEISRVADLTGGFGIDSFFLSSLSGKLDFVEPDAELLNIVQHNYSVLGRTNVAYHNTSAEDFLKQESLAFDLIYVDPSRRSNQRKVFKLEDCTPSIPQLQAQLFSLSPYLLIKTSPLLDIAQGLKEIPFVKKIFIVSVDNECKELLFFCQRGYSSSPAVETFNLQKTSRQTFSFQWGDENSAQAAFSEPLTFLYEANASILKSGCFKLIGEKFQLKKIHPNTHLYTSTQLIKDFPGRVFKIENDKIDIKKDLPEQKANVLTRNYPLKPDELRKKLKLKEGGEKFVIAFSSMSRKHVVVASKVL